MACVVCSSLGEPSGPSEVRRWHLGRIPEQFQSGLLDVDVASYVDSVAEELRSRSTGLGVMTGIAARYQREFGETGTRPRGTDLRPVQLACQNVVVGLATLRQDALFDGLRVSVFLTCETPHVATHEANRAMAALILCDAFQNGGTMEVRFGDRGKELFVPPALARFARTVGVALGSDDPHCISPAEARDLFLAATPIPEDLRMRCEELMDRRLISPERLCYTLMAAVWSPIELDYIAATSSRVEDILRGGSPEGGYGVHLAEVEVCRAAVMVGMLQRHIDNSGEAGRATKSVRVFEDRMAQVSWSILGEVGAVAVVGLATDNLPWVRDAAGTDETGKPGAMICVPRGLPIPADYELVRELQVQHPEATVTLLSSADMVHTIPGDLRVLACPDRLADLDADIERRFAMLRVGRL